MNVEALSWMTGSWYAMRKDSLVEETWMPPKGGTLVGVSRTATSEGTKYEEYMRIGEWEGKTCLVLIHRLGDKVDTFAAESLTADEAKFNGTVSEGDVCIHYRRVADGMDTTVSGTRDGEPFKLEFPFRRSAS